MQYRTIMTMLCPWGNTYYIDVQHNVTPITYRFMVKTDGMTYTEHDISDLPVCHQRNMTTMFNAVEYVDTCTQLEICETRLHDLLTERK